MRTPAGTTRSTQDEDLALVLQRLKALALERQVALFVVSQLSRFAAKREQVRPDLDDFGHLGAIKQHADVALGLFREEMYRSEEHTSELQSQSNLVCRLLL